MEPDNIAWQGEVELLAASWTLKAGSMVDFRICGDTWDTVHPFMAFTRRRGNRAGARFRVSFADTKSGEVSYTGELMLAQWKHDYRGQTVKFWMQEEGVHPFANSYERNGELPGCIYAVVMVEISEDERPVNQAAAARAEKTEEKKPKKKSKLSSQAHLMVSTPMFVRFVDEMYPHVPAIQRKDPKQWARDTLSIESFSELDRNPEAEQRFHELVRKPYLRWKEQEG